MRFDGDVIRRRFQVVGLPTMTCERFGKTGAQACEGNCFLEHLV
jgi:hypothetical protein